MTETNENQKEMLILTGETRLSTVLTNIPAALEYIVSLNPHDFKRLHNPFLRKYMSPRISLSRLAAMTGLSESELLGNLYRLAGVKPPETISTAAKLPQSPTEPPAWLNVEPAKISWVDVLLIDNVGGDPLPPISLAVKQLAPCGVLGIKHRWEPQPLYDIWQKMGLQWYARQIGDHEWHIFVYKPQLHLRSALPPVVFVELEHLPQGERMPRVLAMFEQLQVEQSLEVKGAAPLDEQQIRLALENKYFNSYDWQTERVGGKTVVRIKRRAV
jgi:uncharacterized protein (DUF2249 family)